MTATLFPIVASSAPSAWMTGSTAGCKAGSSRSATCSSFSGRAGCWRKFPTVRGAGEAGESACVSILPSRVSSDRHFAWSVARIPVDSLAVLTDSALAQPITWDVTGQDEHIGGENQSTKKPKRQQEPFHADLCMHHPVGGKNSCASVVGSPSAILPKPNPRAHACTSCRRCVSPRTIT